MQKNGSFPHVHIYWNAHLYEYTIKSKYMEKYMCKFRGTKSAAAVHTDRVPFLISARHATFLPSFGCIFFLFFKLFKMFKNLEEIGK